MIASTSLSRWLASAALSLGLVLVSSTATLAEVIFLKNGKEYTVKIIGSDEEKIIISTGGTKRFVKWDSIVAESLPRELREKHRQDLLTAKARADALSLKGQHSEAVKLYAIVIRDKDYLQKADLEMLRREGVSYKATGFIWKDGQWIELEEFRAARVNAQPRPSTTGARPTTTGGAGTPTAPVNKTLEAAEAEANAKTPIDWKALLSNQTFMYKVAGGGIGVLLVVLVLVKVLKGSAGKKKKKKKKKPRKEEKKDQEAEAAEEPKKISLPRAAAETPPKEPAAASPAAAVPTAEAKAAPQAEAEEAPAVKKTPLPKAEASAAEPATEEKKIPLKRAATDGAAANEAKAAPETAEDKPKKKIPLKRKSADADADDDAEKEKADDRPGGRTVKKSGLKKGVAEAEKRGRKALEETEPKHKKAGSRDLDSEDDAGPSKKKLSLKKKGEADEAAAPEEDAADVGLSGTLEEFSMVDLLQFINSTAQSGVLRLNGANATIYINAGEIIDANCGPDSGEEAVYSAMRNTSGPFQFASGDQGGQAQTINQNTVSLIMEGCRRLDEESREAEENEA